MKILGELVKDATRQYSSFADFLCREIHTDRGLYTFDRHKALEQIVREMDEAARNPDTELSALKGAQIGFSTLAIGYSAFLAAILQQNNGYFLPTEVFAKRFDKTRFRQIIVKNKYLASLMKTASYQGINIAGLKEFAGKFVYTLGLFNVANAISIPLDANIYDEVDVLPEENLEWSDDRIAASDLRLRLFLSVGMLPGLGIHAKFLEGTQTCWHVKCPGCGKADQILPDLFPACVRRIDDIYRIACVRCGRPMDAEEDGQWVDHYPSRRKDRKISFRVSQLEIPAVALSYIMDRWEKAQKKRSRKAKFNCSTLAKPDGGDMQPITDVVLGMARGDYSMSIAATGNPRFIGVDCGDMVHLACHERLPNGRKRYIWFEEIDSDEMETRIIFLMGKLQAAATVIDSKPLRSEARRIAYSNVKKVWLQDFKNSESIEDEEGEHQGKKFQRVLTGRDASLDDFADLFSRPEKPEGLIMLPRKDAESNAVLDIVDIHLKNLQKEKMIDAKGNTIFQYKKTVANHFGMAMNSSIIAEAVARLFTGSNPAPLVVLSGVKRTVNSIFRGYGNA